MPEEKLLENPFAIIADEDAAAGYRALGFKVYALKDESGLKSILEEVRRSGAAVCLVQDDIYESQKKEIDSYRNMPLPVFMPLAAKDSGKDLFKDIVRDIRIKATGAL